MAGEGHGEEGSFSSKEERALMEPYSEEPDVSKATPTVHHSVSERYSFGNKEALREAVCWVNEPTIYFKLLPFWAT